MPVYAVGADDEGRPYYAMKLVAGNLSRRVRFGAPTLQQRGLNPYQGVLQAIWSDERIASACVAMSNTDEVNQNTDAARRFEPMNQTEIHELRAALLDAGPIMCAACDGRCARAAGTDARLGDLTRFAHPRALMAYLGLVPSEHSSAAPRRNEEMRYPTRGY